MCNDLIELFGWPEYSGSDIKFRKATVLRELGKTKEASEFCEKWMQKEPENVVAATAGVYVFIDTKEYDKATKKMKKTTPAAYKKYPWLKEGDFLVLANVQLHLEKAYKNFFANPPVGLLSKKLLFQSLRA